MTLGEAVLQEKVKRYELQEHQNIIFNPMRLSTLEAVVNDVYVALHPKPNDYDNRHLLILDFNELAEKIYGDKNGFPIVVAFGSFVMDMFTSNSDLDLSVNFSNDASVFPRQKKISALRKLLRVLYARQRKGHVSNIQPILSARIPIVKYIDKATGVECDISIENKDGITRSWFLQTVSSIDVRFQKLCCMMKAWAKSHGINSAKDHTLSSLSITLLVAFHLQTRDPPILPPFSTLLADGMDNASIKNATNRFQYFGMRNVECLASLFITLLYKISSAETLWSHGLCASTYEGSWISKTWDSGVGNISVEDFIDRTQNTARSVNAKQAGKIHECIKGSLKILSSFMMGHMDTSRLRKHLFGLDYSFSPSELLHFDSISVSRKRNFHPRDPPLPDYIPLKRMRYEEIPIETHYLYSKMPGRPIISTLHPPWQILGNPTSQFPRYSTPFGHPQLPPSFYQNPSIKLNYSDQTFRMDEGSVRFPSTFIPTR